MGFDSEEDLRRQLLKTAQKFNHNYISIDHLYLLLLTQDEDARVLMTEANVDPAPIVKKLTGILEQTAPIVGVKPYQDAMERILKMSRIKRAEGLATNTNFISGIDLLHGALDVGRTMWPADELRKALGKSKAGRDSFVQYSQYKEKVMMEDVRARAAAREYEERKQREKKMTDTILTRVKETPLLAEFSRDLTELARQGKLDPCIGRDPEIEQVLDVLACRTKNNPVLVGEPGVGKTAIVEGLAQMIVNKDENLPSFLQDKRILALDISLIVAGTKYRGQFEERLKAIMKELSDNPDIVVFIDELHTLVGAGSAEGSLDAANILKPALARGEIRCIGATTTNEFRKYIEKDKSLERRFQAVKVDEPDKAQTMDILRGKRGRYQDFHHVEYSDEFLEEVSRVARRYVTDRFSPDREIDLLDRSGARTHIMSDLAGTPSSVSMPVQMSTLHKVASRLTHVPLGQVSANEKETLLHLKDKFEERVFAQETATDAVARKIKKQKAGLANPNKPLGSFLFAGPTGVGKTELARAVAEFVMHDENAIVRMDMSEYMEKHSVSKLIGSPPGYVGHEQGGQLTEKVKRAPYSVVLLDEVEKAHPDVLNVLLQVFEDGHLTDGLGNKINFKNTVVIMTSNVGANVKRDTRIGGFSNESQEGREAADKKRHILDEIKKRFLPEFLNRIDEIVVFDPLDKNEAKRVARKFLADLGKRLEENKIAFDPDLDVSPAAYDYLAQKGHSDEYGARPMRRLIEREIEDEATNQTLAHDQSGKRMKVDVNNGSLSVAFGEAAAATTPANDATENAFNPPRLSAPDMRRGPS